MSKIHDLMARGTELLGSDYAILCGAMSWVSERNLVSAISNAGGFGVIACGSMSPELLAREIAATRDLTTKPFVDFFNWLGNLVLKPFGIPPASDTTAMSVVKTAPCVWQRARKNRSWSVRHHLSVPSPSPSARVTATLPSLPAASRDTSMMLVRFWKS